MQFGWLTLSLSPSPEEDATRIDQQLARLATRRSWALTMCG